MLRQATWVARAAFAACMLAMPVIIHLAIVKDHWTTLIVVLPIVQVLIIGWALTARRRAWAISLTVVLAVSLFAFFSTHKADFDAKIFPVLPHALAYLGLLFGFAWSLRPGHEAVLTRVATRIRGPLPAELKLYSRRVTFAWCIFFASQLVLSLTLFLWAPFEVWSFFVNVLNAPLVALMFGGEYLFRLIRLPKYRHDSLSDMMRVFQKAGEARPRQADSV